jgi:FMN phosphatase YigB (HAD superfamily)
MDYPFADRLHPSAMKVLRRLRDTGPTVIFSDGDAVFQPRKIERSGIRDAVNGHVLIYIHKEEALSDVELHYPARHYVAFDHEPRILAALHDTWWDKVTTVWVRNSPWGHGAVDAGPYAPPDLTVEDIGELLDCDLSSLFVRNRIEAA